MLNPWHSQKIIIMKKEKNIGRRSFVRLFHTTGNEVRFKTLSTKLKFILEQRNVTTNDDAMEHQNPSNDTLSLSRSSHVMLYVRMVVSYSLLSCWTDCPSRLDCLLVHCQMFAKGECWLFTTIWRTSIGRICCFNHLPSSLLSKWTQWEF